MKGMSILLCAAVLVAGTSFASAESNLSGRGKAGASVTNPGINAGADVKSNTNANTRSGANSTTGSGATVNTPAGNANVKSNTGIGVNTGK